MNNRKSYKGNKVEKEAEIWLELQEELGWRRNYCKNPKNLDILKNSFNYSKIWKVWFYHREKRPKDVDGLANSVDPGSDQDQDQDSLLVKRRNDNHSPGPVIRELVPSSHQRSELSNTILCIFSGWDQRIGEGIPIPDSLGEEATFINICIGNGSLKCHRVLIPTTPSFGDKVICWYTGFTFKTFI